MTALIVILLGIALPLTLYMLDMREKMKQPAKATQTPPDDPNYPFTVKEIPQRPHARHRGYKAVGLTDNCNGCGKWHGECTDHDCPDYQEVKFFFREGDDG